MGYKLQSIEEFTMWTKIRQAILECADGQFRKAVLEANDALFGDDGTERCRAAFSNILDESAYEEQPDSEIFKNIREGKWDTNGDLEHDYPIFMEAMRKSRHPASLTWYTMDEYARCKARLYKVAGFDAGFAIKNDPENKGEIVSVFNNTNIRGVAPELMKKAVEYGGDHLDHYAYPRLNDVYSGAGFEEYQQFPWDDKFAPKDWNYEKDGRPHVIMRGLKSYADAHRTKQSAS